MTVKLLTLICCVASNTLPSTMSKSRPPNSATGTGGKLTPLPQTQAAPAAISNLTKHHHHHHRSDVEELPNILDTRSFKGVFKKSIVGDLFGSNGEGLDGLMYRSRVPLEQSTGARLIQKIEEDVEDHKVESVAASSDVQDNDTDSDDEMKFFSSMNPKQQLALTMMNWTASEKNDHHIVKEGGIQALIALCSVEDPLVRKCCATSFYYLSSREKNRSELLAAGATNGVVLCLHGSPPRCTWKVAKFCALSLCNLSMEAGGERTMAAENAVGALVQLSTYRGTALMAICIQALYNMTCTGKEHFKGMERIIKAFLTMTSSLPDHAVLIVRAFVNVARYRWVYINKH